MPFDKGLGGVHAHAVDRENMRTEADGPHAHVYLMLDGTPVHTASDGAHLHGLEHPDSNESSSTISGHRHLVIMPDGTKLFTEVGGKHSHELQIETTAFDGLHVHDLKLLDETVLVSMTPGEWWRHTNKVVDDPVVEEVVKAFASRHKVSGETLPYDTLPDLLEAVRCSDYLQPIQKLADGSFEPVLHPDNIVSIPLRSLQRRAALMKVRSSNTDAESFMGVALEPSPVFPARDVRAIAHAFMASGVRKTDDGLHLVQSYINPAEVTTEGIVVPKGAWVIGFIQVLE